MTAVVSHDRRICGHPVATEPVYERPKWAQGGKGLVVGYVHAECRAARAEQARRRRLAKEADKAEQAGQGLLFARTTEEG